jgi:hypothetical protein
MVAAARERFPIPYVLIYIYRRASMLYNSGTQYRRGGKKGGRV